MSPILVVVLFFEGVTGGLSQSSAVHMRAVLPSAFTMSTSACIPSHKACNQDHPNENYHSTTAQSGRALVD
eukprot:6212650-Amphidinium_carterae.1